MRRWSRSAGMLALCLALPGVLATPAAASARKVRSALRASPDAGHAAPRGEVLELALRAFRCAQTRGEVAKPMLAVIDYTLPSSEKRLWLIDTRNGRVLQRELVAHGRGSGELFAEQFSNEPESYQSSLGFFVAKDSYRGKHGLSLRLEGLEPGVNDRADARAIVIHGASYVSEEHVARWGRLGRSLGCPALAPGVTPTVIERLRGGAAVFAYGPDREWLRRSSYLRCEPEALPARVVAHPG